jgi:hypothetical protein
MSKDGEVLAERIYEQNELIEVSGTTIAFAMIGKTSSIDFCSEETCFISSFTIHDDPLRLELSWAVLRAVLSLRPISNDGPKHHNVDPVFFDQDLKTQGTNFAADGNTILRQY